MLAFSVGVECRYYFAKCSVILFDMLNLIIDNDTRLLLEIEEKGVFFSICIIKYVHWHTLKAIKLAFLVIKVWFP